MNERQKDFLKQVIVSYAEQYGLDIPHPITTMTTHILIDLENNVLEAYESEEIEAIEDILQETVELMQLPCTHFHIG